MDTQLIETKALRIYEINRQIAIFEEEKQLLKNTIKAEMQKGNEEEVLVRLDDMHDIKVVVAERRTVKLDKEELATDLGISLDAVSKRDVLIKKTEEGKLSAETYKRYLYEDVNTQVQIRKVNA